MSDSEHEDTIDEETINKLMVIPKKGKAKTTRTKSKVKVEEPLKNNTEQSGELGSSLAEPVKVPETIQEEPAPEPESKPEPNPSENKVKEKKPLSDKMKAAIERRKEKAAEAKRIKEAEELLKQHEKLKIKTPVNANLSENKVRGGNNQEQGGWLGSSSEIEELKKEIAELRKTRGNSEEIAQLKQELAELRNMKTMTKNEDEEKKIKKQKEDEDLLKMMRKFGYKF